jgi:hypothetical protein
MNGTKEPEVLIFYDQFRPNGELLIDFVFVLL